MNTLLRRMLYTSREFGLDPKKTFSALAGLWWFTADLLKYKSTSKENRLQILPVFSDKHASSGNADGHYFWQDLICAKWIFEDSPGNHLDVGSRIDGFIAHLLTFMNVHQIDVRMNPTQIEGLTTVVADLTRNFQESKVKYSSVSSLHSLEHFGLGRYGDTLNPVGHELGLINLSSFVSSGGFLYVSYPVGDGVVQFNSQRLLPADWATKILKDFSLLQFVAIPWRGIPVFHKGYPHQNLFPKGSAILMKLMRI
jgi:hypothetical protein